ncbi:YhcN/YlaJ family sporulation lipoprotein [Paenibacillus sp. GCM10012307]|uniref:Sporulation lipoprotein YhcN/YlaJ (Spore_YhcN_YlaJ) n=1 Tax=Paenibacillus roseus TaxID=2798579 RepID=A0A934J8Z2_9BACL|nr:YhcN/YlaJ family sporulation lipoprotein [Paenibacillus roseus]MBJ6362856.1 hypothetical protein [Paenibacillus roseus]
MFFLRQAGSLSSRRSLLLLLSLVIGASALTGCNYTRRVQDSDYDYGSRQKGDPKMLQPRLYGSLTGRKDQHDNKFFEYSSMLSREVSGINGVATGIVMLTDKNAYVGIALDWTAVGTKKTGGRDAREQNNTGTNEGTYNYDNGSPYYNNQKLITPYNSYFSVNDNNQLSGKLKQTIAAKIRNFVPKVQEVHISANKEFVNEMVDYAKEAWAGRSLTPLTSEFNTFVKYQFADGVIMPRSVHELKTIGPKDQR